MHGKKSKAEYDKSKYCSHGKDYNLHANSGLLCVDERNPIY